MPVIINLTFSIIFLSGAFASLISRPLAILLDVLVPPSGLGIPIVGINPISSEIAWFSISRVPVAFLDTNPSTCSLAQGLGHETVCADVLNSNVYEEALEQGFGRLLLMTPDEALNQLVAQAAAIHLGSDHVYQVRADSAGESLIIETKHLPKKAFSKDFTVQDALRDIMEGQASMNILDIVSDIPEGVIPLVALAENGKGVDIIHEDYSVSGTALCFVREVREGI